MLIPYMGGPADGGMAQTGEDPPFSILVPNKMTTYELYESPEEMASLEHSEFTDPGLEACIHEYHLVWVPGEEPRYQYVGRKK
jgi:hypothetical protein